MRLIKKLVSLVFASLFLLSTMVGVLAQNVHDVAVVSVTVTLPYGADACYPGWGNYPEEWRQIRIAVVVENLGTEYENFTVTTYYDDHAIQDYYGNHTQAVINLASGSNATLTFAWNTKGVKPCTYSGSYIPYTISANASIVAGETNTANNYKVDGTVVVRRPGDATGDGHCKVGDLAILGCFWYGGSYPSHGYNWLADFNGNRCIDVGDLAIIGANFYKDYHGVYPLL